MMRPAQIRKKISRARYEPPVSAKRWPQVTTPAEFLDSVRERSRWRTPRAELHELEVYVMCGVADSPGAEWLAELMSIA